MWQGCARPVAEQTVCHRQTAILVTKICALLTGLIHSNWSLQKCSDTSVFKACSLNILEKMFFPEVSCERQRSGLMATLKYTFLFDLYVLNKCMSLSCPYLEPGEG